MAAMTAMTAMRTTSGRPRSLPVSASEDRANTAAMRAGAGGPRGVMPCNRGNRAGRGATDTPASPRPTFIPNRILLRRADRRARRAEARLAAKRKEIEQWW